MKRAVAIAAILSLCCMGFAAAQQQAVPSPRQNVPDVYVVKKGDTLWDISEVFFQNPLSWPDIWKKNVSIADPHWIYPGQQLTLGDVVQILSQPQPQPRAQTASPASAQPSSAPAPKPAAPPQTRIIQADSKSASGGMSAAAPADRPGTGNVLTILASPQPTYRRENFIRTGFITKRSEIPVNRVVGIDKGDRSATVFDTITIDMGRGAGPGPGGVVELLGIGDTVRHPDTGADLGVVMRIKGIAEILTQDETLSVCRVTENFDPILLNDRVMTASFPQAPQFDAWLRPGQELRSTILAVNEPLLSIHVNDIVYIDKGSDEGVAPGDRFAIFSRADDKTSVENRASLGELQAVNVMAHETAVLVTAMSDNTIRIGDRAELVARCRILR